MGGMSVMGLMAFVVSASGAFFSWRYLQQFATRTGIVYAVTKGFFYTCLANAFFAMPIALENAQAAHFTISFLVFPPTVVVVYMYNQPLDHPLDSRHFDDDSGQG